MELGFVEAVQLQVVCYRLWNNLPRTKPPLPRNISLTGSVNNLYLPITRPD
jgi:hypothetical protein